MRYLMCFRTTLWKTWKLHICIAGQEHVHISALTQQWHVTQVTFTLDAQSFYKLSSHPQCLINHHPFTTVFCSLWFITLPVDLQILYKGGMVETHQIFLKYFIVQYIDRLLQVKAISALGNVLCCSEQSDWPAFTDDPRKDAGQWRCSSQLLHLSALLPPSPNFIHSNQQRHPYQQSFMSCKVYRGLPCTVFKSPKFHHLSVNSCLPHLPLSGLPPSLTAPHRYTSQRHCTLVNRQWVTSYHRYL